MRKKRLDKKAVSPLIATVLLIAFAVALGAIVMNWGRGYVEDTQEFARSSSEGQLTCSSDVQMEFSVINIIQENDTEGTLGEINITLMSEGGTDIYDLAIQLITSDSQRGNVLIDDEFLNPAIDDENINNPVLPQFTFLTFVIEDEDIQSFSDTDLDEVIELKVIPKISSSSGNENVPCVAKAVTIIKSDGEWQYDDQG